MHTKDMTISPVRQQVKFEKDNIISPVRQQVKFEKDKYYFSRATATEG